MRPSASSRARSSSSAAALRNASRVVLGRSTATASTSGFRRSEEHTSELQSQSNLVCRLLLEKKKKNTSSIPSATISVAYVILPVIPTYFQYRYSSLHLFRSASREEWELGAVMLVQRRPTRLT